MGAALRVRFPFCISQHFVNHGFDGVIFKSASLEHCGQTPTRHDRLKPAKSSGLFLSEAAGGRHRVDIVIDGGQCTLDGFTFDAGVHQLGFRAIAAVMLVLGRGKRASSGEAFIIDVAELRQFVENILHQVLGELSAKKFPTELRSTVEPASRNFNASSRHSWRTSPCSISPTRSSERIIPSRRRNFATTFSLQAKAKRPSR